MLHLITEEKIRFFFLLAEHESRCRQIAQLKIKLLLQSSLSSTSWLTWRQQISLQCVVLLFIHIPVSLLLAGYKVLLNDIIFVHFWHSVPLRFSSSAPIGPLWQDTQQPPERRTCVSLYLARGAAGLLADVLTSQTLTVSHVKSQRRRNTQHCAQKETTVVR